LIGFSGSPEMSIDLTLIAIAHGIDKSKLLRKIVGDWLKNQHPLESVIATVKQLRESEEGKALSLKDFKAKISVFLKEKKVPDAIISHVLKSV
jgi:hypothetical protein